MEQDGWIKNIGGLLADRSRSAMLVRLMDGRAYTATELAYAANVAAPTASHHLERLKGAGLLECVKMGRHSYFRIANDDVAAYMEQTMAVHAGLNAREIETSCPANLRRARFCYRHLAGNLGVKLLAAGLELDLFIPEGDGVRTAEPALPLLAELGVAADARGHFCLDWSERRFHLSGPLATGLARGMLDARWLLQGQGRALTLTEKGRRELKRWFGI